MTTIRFPNDLPAERLANGLALIGLELDPNQDPDGVWSVRPIRSAAKCDKNGCRCEANVRLDGMRLCSRHAAEVFGCRFLSVTGTLSRTGHEQRSVIAPAD